MLAGFGAKVGVMNKNGDTPLHNAARVGVALCCRFLIQRGMYNNVTTPLLLLILLFYHLQVNVSFQTPPF